MKNRNIEHKDDWKTPKWLYDKLNKEFEFDFDPCPLHSKVDALDHGFEWGKRNFINPPYSKNLKEAFIKKAYEKAQNGRLCVLLLPVSTSTKIFHEIIYPNSEIRFIKGRVRFEGVNTLGKLVDEISGHNPMHDSMVVIFNNCKEKKGSQLKLF